MKQNLEPDPHGLNSLLALSRPDLGAWASVEDAFAVPTLQTVDLVRWARRSTSSIQMMQRLWRLSQRSVHGRSVRLHLPADLVSALTTCSSKPLSAARATLEAARWRDLVEGDSTWLSDTAEIIGGSAFSRIDERRHRALMALTEVYTADAFRRRGHFDDSSRALEAARTYCDHTEAIETSLDAASRILIAEASLATMRGDLIAADGHLQIAEALLRGPHSEWLRDSSTARARAAEISLRRARLALRQYNAGRATALLEDALVTVPTDRDRRLEVEILLELAHSVLARSRLTSPERDLSRARDLLERYSRSRSDIQDDPSLDATHKRLEAQLLLRCGSPDALEVLEEAIDQLVSVGRVVEAAGTLQYLSVDARKRISEQISSSDEADALRPIFQRQIARLGNRRRQMRLASSKYLN